MNKRFSVRISAFKSNLIELPTIRDLSFEVDQYLGGSHVDVIDLSTRFHFKVSFVSMTKFDASLLQRKLQVMFKNLPLLVEIKGIQSVESDIFWPTIGNQEVTSRAYIRDTSDQFADLNLTKLYLSGLPESINHSELRRIFSCFGGVKKVFVSDKFMKGKHVFGFVDFYLGRSAHLAVQERKILIRMNWVSVKLTKPEQQKAIILNHSTKCYSSQNKLYYEPEFNPWQKPNLNSGNIQDNSLPLRQNSCNWQISELFLKPLSIKRILREVSDRHTFLNEELIRLNRDKRQISKNKLINL